MFFSPWRAERQRKNTTKQTTPPSPRRKSKWQPKLEALEDRLAPATHVWSGALSSSWNNVGNWSSGGVPRPGEAQLVIVFPPGGVGATPGMAGYVRAASVNDVPQTLTVGEIDITGTPSDAASFTISGNAVTLGNASVSFSTGSAGNIEDSSGNPNDVVNFAGIALAASATPGAPGHDLSSHGTLTIQSPVSGTGAGLTINLPPTTAANPVANANGFVVLQGANTYTGQTIVNGGTLIVRNSNALGTPGPIGSGGDTVLNNNAVLEFETDLNGNPIAVGAEGLTVNGTPGTRLVNLTGSNSFAGNIQLNTPTTVQVAAQLTLNGIISGSSTFGLTKQGAGTMILAGNNTYSGTTDIEMGTVDVNGLQSSSPINIAAGGALGGTGTTGPIGSSFGTSDLGVIAPAGPNATGTLTSVGSVAFGAGSSFNVDILSTSQHDLLSVQGNAVNLGSATLNVNSVGLVAPAGTQFTILQVSGTVTGQFANAAEGTVIPGTSLQVHYTGNSVILTQVGRTATVSSFTSAPNPSVFGQPVTFTLTFSPSLVPAPTGTVQFLDNGTPIGGPVLVQNGSASFTTPGLSVGPHTITARYSGDSTYAASSTTLSQTVNAGSTSTALMASSTSVTAGSPVQLTANVTVTPPAAGTPTGTVLFTDTFTPTGSTTATTTTVGDVPLSGSPNAGTATISTGPLAAGVHTFQAVYSGDTSFGGSASPTVAVTVTPPLAFHIWLGGDPGSPTSWSDPRNWVGGVPNGGNADLVFPSGSFGVSTNDIPIPNLTIHSIEIDGAPHPGTGTSTSPNAYTINGSPITLNTTVGNAATGASAYIISAGAAHGSPDTGPTASHIALGIILGNSTPSVPQPAAREDISAVAGDKLFLDGVVSGGANTALDVNGPIAANALTGLAQQTSNKGTVFVTHTNNYTSPTDVADGTLGGTGTVGRTTVDSGGTLAPGIGTSGALTVTDALIFHAGASLVLPLTSAGEPAPLHVLGPLNLGGPGGTTLHLVVSPGFALPDRATLTLIQNGDGPAQGTFALPSGQALSAGILLLHGVQPPNFTVGQHLEVSYALNQTNNVGLTNLDSKQLFILSLFSDFKVPLNPQMRASLDTIPSLATIADKFLASPAQRLATLTFFYQQLGLSTADPNFNKYLNGLVNGSLQPSDVLIKLTTSRQFTRSHRSNAKFARGLFDGLLGNAPGITRRQRRLVIQGLVQGLNLGTLTRATAAQQLLSSDAVLTEAIRENSVTFLDRPPRPDEVASDLAVLKQGGTNPDELSLFFLLQPEHLNAFLTRAVNSGAAVVI